MEFTEVSKLENIIKSCYKETIETFNKWNLYHPEKLHNCDLAGVFKSYLVNKIRATYYNGNSRRFFIDDMRKIQITVNIENNKLYVYCDNKHGSNNYLNYQYNKYFSQLNGQYDIFQSVSQQEVQTDFQSIINNLNNYKF